MMKVKSYQWFLPMLACVLAMLTICLCSPIASAHTSIYPGGSWQQRYIPVREPSVSVVQFRNRVFFSQAVVTCHTQINCLTIHNGLNRYVYLYLNGRYYDPMWGGETISPTLRWGRNVFTIPQLNRFVTLVVIVQPPVRYGWWMQPMQQPWQRF